METKKTKNKAPHWVETQSPPSPQSGSKGTHPAGFSRRIQKKINLKTELNEGRKMHLIRSGKASPIATLKYIISRLKSAINSYYCASRKSGGSYPHRSIRVVPSRAFDASDTTSDATNVFDPGYHIMYAADLNMLAGDFRADFNIASLGRFPETMAERIRPRCYMAKYMDVVGRDNAGRKMSSLAEHFPDLAKGYLVAVVLPNTIAGIKIKDADRVIPMALIPGTANESEDIIWELRTINCAKDYFSGEYTTPYTAVGITLDELLFAFVYWNKEKRKSEARNIKTQFTSLSKDDRKPYNASIIRALMAVRISPMCSLYEISEIADSAYHNTEVFRQAGISYIPLDRNRILAQRHSASK